MTLILLMDLQCRQGSVGTAGLGSTSCQLGQPKNGPGIPEGSLSCIAGGGSVGLNI